MLDKRLQQLITTLGIKKGDFATKIGFSQAYVSMILNGKRPNPSERFYDSVNRQFQVSTDWLKDGDGEMFELPSTSMNSSDIDLLKKYNSLPLSERAIIDRLVNSMILEKEEDQ